MCALRTTPIIWFDNWYVPSLLLHHICFIALDSVSILRRLKLPKMKRFWRAIGRWKINLEIHSVLFYRHILTSPPAELPFQTKKSGVPKRLELLWMSYLNLMQRRCIKSKNLNKLCNLKPMVIYYKMVHTQIKESN